MTGTSAFIDHFRAALRIKTDWPASAGGGVNFDGINFDSAKISDAKVDGTDVVDPAATMPAEAPAVMPLLRFQEFLVQTYPAFHKAAERWVLSPYSVVYRWPGTAAGAVSGNAVFGAAAINTGGNSVPDPLLLLAHYDVVPAETAKWTVDPFGAELKDGYVYGRGALDMKSITMAIMESAELLCKQGFAPRRDVWIALGGDEERTGISGAQKTARWFLEKNLRFSFILDEGTPVAVGQLKGVDKPLALVGIEEKGYVSVDLTVEQKPGHASQPAEQQAAAVLARALLRLSRRPFPWRLTPAVEAFFRQLSPHARGITGFVMRHARLLGPLFFKAAAVSPATRALLRTTLAMTQLEGSAADNVMPSVVRAVLNLRLLPPWTVGTAIERLKALIADSRVNVTVHGFASNPVEAGPGQTAMTSPGWNEINAALETAFPAVPALPFLMLATTDSRHYQEFSRNIFRFSPQLLDQAELSRIHGHDERISLDNLNRCLAFYTALLQQL
ncbi:MAG: M20/M25/M40 family metallo-hydrolase [Treponema sp.]|jgi:carboxypeptidase PM20D1|nr:M20/M25/M40 family metallo-hydrolase [Treponema sp.]